MTAEKLSYYFSVLVVSFLLHLLKAYWMEKLLVFKYALASYNKCFRKKVPAQISYSFVFWNESNAP